MLEWTYVPAAARISCLCESPESKNRNPSNRPTVIPSSAAGPNPEVKGGIYGINDGKEWSWRGVSRRVKEQEKAWNYRILENHTIGPRRKIRLTRRERKKHEQICIGNKRSRRVREVRILQHMRMWTYHRSNHPCIRVNPSYLSYPSSHLITSHHISSPLLSSHLLSAQRTCECHGTAWP
jgi:hypothetical protein